MIILFFSICSARMFLCFRFALRLRRTMMRYFQAQETAKGMSVRQRGLIRAIRRIVKFLRQTSTSNATTCNCCVFQVNRLIMGAFRGKDRLINCYSTGRGRIYLTQANANCLRPRAHRVMTNYTRNRRFSATATNYGHGEPR